MRVFLSSNWHFIAAAGLLLAAFVHALRGSPGLPRALKALRFSAAALAALILVRPYAVLYRSVPEPPRVAVLLDSSLYMREGRFSEGSGTAKYAVAAAWLGKHLPGLKGGAGLECYVFSDRLYRTDCSSFPAAGLSGGAYSESDLGGALASLAGASNGGLPDRVWAFTDGLSLSGKDPALPPDGSGNGVDIVSVGETAPPRGVTLTGLSGPPFAFAHIPFLLSGTARVSGMKGSRVELLLKDGNGSVIGKRSFAIRDGDEMVVSSFSVSAPSVGRAEYTLCASSASGAPCSAPKKFRVSVIREKLRVMYLAGRPSFEYAFLRGHLKAQSGIDLVSFVILRNPEDMPGTDGRELSLIPFPVSEIFLRDIYHFDVFIMQDFDLRRFAANAEYIASLSEFVRRGGGLAVLGGPSAFSAGGYYGMPRFSDMLPSEAGGLPGFDGGLEYTVFPSGHAASLLFPARDAGPLFWSGVPSLKGVNALGPLKAGANAVFYYKDPVSGGRSVFSAEKGHGKGRVMEIAGTSTWRWKMMGAERPEYSGLYQAFWSRTLAYLDGSLSLEKVSLEELPGAGAGRRFRLKVLNANYLPPSGDEPVLVEASLEAGGEKTPVEFSAAGRGLYETSFLPPAAGRNRLKVYVRIGKEYLGSAESVFETGGAPGFVPSDEAALKRTAERMGGGYYRLDPDEGPAELLKNLPPARKGRKEASRFAPESSTAVMLLAAALFLASWVLGRLKGLP